MEETPQTEIVDGVLTEKEVDEFATDIDIDDITFEDIADIDKIEEKEKGDIIPEEFKEELTETKKGKKKGTKKTADPFLQFCKKYLSSLIARTSKYAIFNLDSEHMNTVIFMSSRMKMTFEDYLLQFSPGDLALHIVEFKQDQLKVLKEKLHISETLTLVNLVALRNALNGAMRNRVEKVPVLFTHKGTDLYLKYKKEQEIEKETEEGIVKELISVDHIERYGLAYTDWRTICILRNLVKKMETTEDTEVIVKIPVKYEDIAQYVYQNLLFYPVEITAYKKDGAGIYTGNPQQQCIRLVYIDGKDIVSLKEYVKKLKGEYHLELISTVSLPDTNVSYMSKFEDDTVKVLSMRPYVCTYPVKR